MIKPRSFMVLVAILALGLMMPGVGSADIITPVGDSWVGSGRPDSNHGQDPVLYVRAAASTVHSYLNFDLAWIPSDYTITKADLYLYVITNPETGQVQAWQTDDDWQQGTITYNNAPDAESLLAEETVAAGSGYWVKWNLLQEGSDWVADALSDDYLSVMLQIATEPGSAYPELASKQNTEEGYHPYLDITAVPVPSSVLLLGSGLLGMVIAVSRKRKIC